MTGEGRSDLWERRVLAALIYALVAVVVFAFTAMVLAGVRSIHASQPTCVTVHVALAEVDCTWSDR